MLFANDGIDLKALIPNIRRKVLAQAHVILDQAGAELMQYLTSYTSEMVPGREKGASPRPAHPGGWGDVSGDLMQEYFYEVEDMGAGPRLKVGNHSEHAVYVEARDGFLVVSGLFEPGGPLEDAVRHAVAAVNAEWKIKKGSVGSPLDINKDARQWTPGLGSAGVVHSD